MRARNVLVASAIALTAFATACSSSSNKPKDAGGDAKTDTSPSDVPRDVVPGPSDGGSETGGDGGMAADRPVLNALQKRGQYLVDHVIACSDCHTPQGPMGPNMAMYMAGVADFIALPNGDKLPSRNLTNDATGLKNRSDAEIKAMFMDGKRPAATGTEALNPVMPYYVFHNMDDADADAIVAYLRTIPPVVNDLPRRSAAFDVPAPANYLNPAMIPSPADNFPNKASAMRGRYLAAQSGLCIECHTPHQMAADVLNTAKYFQGGEDFSAFFASTLMIKPVSKNLTPDMATGLGSWTIPEIVRAMKEGKSKDGSGICPPMPSGPMAAYGGLTNEDATDIANYLKSLAPAVSNIVDMCTFPPMPPPDGGAPEGGASEGGASDVASVETAGDVAAAD